MTLARFKALVEAYGGRLARWPAEELEAAERLLAEYPSLHALLEQTRVLDSALESWTLSLPTGLATRIFAAAPTGRRALHEVGAAWLPRAGMVGALGVGAFAGAALVLTAAPLHVRNEGWGSLYDQTSFGDLAQIEPPVNAGMGG